MISLSYTTFNHVLATFDKLTSSYSIFIKEDEHVRSIVMEGLRIIE
jgi:hypothetical protein